jgi:predicted ATPase
MAFASGVAARVCQLRQERQAAQERAEAAISLSTEHGFPFWLGWASVLRGWAVAEQGQGEEGIAQIRQGLAVYRATGAEVNQSYFLALLTEAYGVAGQTEEGLTVLAEALTLVGGTGDRMWEAELYRLKGQLTLQQFQVSGSKFQVTNPQSPTPNSHAEAEAEACFLKALDIARRQQAKSLELRAAMSLARLGHQQGKTEQARHLLAEVYNWFTEGFDTKDLQEAKVLLEELS